MKPKRLITIVISSLLTVGIIGFQPSTAQASVQVGQYTSNIQTAEKANALSSAKIQSAVGEYWFRVPSGSTLSSIAYRIYRNAGLWSLIYNANRTRISNPNLIYAGQLIWIPVLGTASAAPISYSSTSTRAQTVIRYALAQVGKQYCWAGNGPYCFDCSGLVKAAFARIGIWLPHQSGSMLRYGTRISRSQLRPGDIVWPQWGHVAIYLGNNRIVHASNPRTDVKTSSLYGFYTARRVIR